jgi:hypothetical protein
MSDSINSAKLKLATSDETLEIEIKAGGNVKKDALKELERLIANWGKQYNVTVEIS